MSELQYHLGSLWEVPMLRLTPTAFDSVALGWVEGSAFSQAPHGHSAQGICRPLLVKFYMEPSNLLGTVRRPS